MNAISLAPAGSRLSLQNALDDFQLVLDHDQQASLSSIKSVPDADSILVFTAELDLANRDRKGRSIGSRLYAVLSSVRNICAVFDMFVSSHPEVAALVWGSVKLTMQIIVNLTSYFEATSELFMRLGHLCPLYGEYQALYPSSQRLQESLSNFHASVIRCCKHVVQATRRPWVNQAFNALWRSFNDEFKFDTEDLGRYGDHVKEAIKLARAHADTREYELQAQERNEAARSRSMVSRLLKRTGHYQHEARSWQLETESRRTRQRKQQVLDALSPHDHIKQLKQNQRKRYRDTAKWIFQIPEFGNWAERLDTTILWCSGKIGSGKTVIAASVIDHLLLTKSDPDDVVSFFFIRSDDRASLKADTVLKSILRQRLPSAAELTDDMEDRIQAITSAGDIDGAVSLLGDITSSRMGSSRTMRSYIVVDGMNECDKLERTALLTGLASFSSRCTGVKLFLAGRESLSREIHGYFPVLQGISTGGVGSHNDIAEYVTGMIREKAENDELRTRDVNILRDIREALIEGANGMFLWVFFQIQDICSQHCDEDIRKIIKNLPRGLPETFCRALRRIQAENHAEAARRVFPWITAATRPLSLDELREAIAIEIGQRNSVPERFFNDMDRIASWCQNLVQLDEEDHTVQFVHQTVRQFLLEVPVEYDVSGFHFRLEDADHSIGEICVTYLNFNDFKRTIGHMRRPVLVPSPSMIAQRAYGRHSIQALALRARLEPKISSDIINIEPTISSVGPKTATLTREYPFLDYASANWFSHTKYFENGKSETWRLWKYMVINEYKTMPGPSKLAGFFWHETEGTELLERMYQTRHYGILHLISSSGSTVRREIIKRAIQNDHLDLLEFVLEMETLLTDACQALKKAAESGNLKAVELLTAAGVDVTGDGEVGRTALHLAAKAGHRKIVDSLLALEAKDKMDRIHRFRNGPGAIY
ncbi:hypothetical protein F5Y07DRAFT_409313 [Xylaria sp. FL0933]|nr:hypothetical protein F5Y07DRAFT_409313 [Xylaria sp. FL0933]